MKYFLALLALVVVIVSLTELSEGLNHWSSGRRPRGRHHHRQYRRDESLRRNFGSRHDFDDWRGHRSSLENSFHMLHRESRSPSISFLDTFWRPRGISSEAPWWTGPNVCENQTVDKTNGTDGEDFLRHIFTWMSCEESDTAYKCKKTVTDEEGRREITIVRECCHGYTRKKGSKGCPDKFELKDLLEKAKDLGLTEFVEAVKTLNLEGELREGNFTVFAPVNGAFGLDSNLIDWDKEGFIGDQPHAIMISEPSGERLLEHVQDTLMGHLVLGTVRTSAMDDEQVLQTTSPEETTIRVNYFVRPEKVMTANCVPVESKDHMASNGVIHVIKKAMKAVTKTFLDIVRSSPDLSTLKTVLASADYVSKLNEDGQMTLLAPTNKAFDDMNPRLRERLLRGDRRCLEKVLQNLLLPNVICSAALRGEARTHNMLRRHVNVTKTKDGKVFVNNAQVVQADLMATNGVIHLIDKVLVPDEALGLVDLMEKEGHTELLKLLDKAHMTKSLTTSANLTLFVPTNKAIQRLPEYVKTKLSSDPDFLRDVLNYHVSPGEKECRHYHDNTLLSTWAEPDIRYNHYHAFHPRFLVQKTVQCVPLQGKHKEACNGVFNVIDNVLLPPKGNVVDVLALNKRFSTLVSLVKQSGLADSLQDEGPYTIFAPNNEAFAKMNPRVLEDLASDTGKIQKFLRNHVYGNTLCCAGIFSGPWYVESEIRTISGQHLTLSRSRDGTPKVGKGRVVKCDQTATNGNVLEIDTVLEIQDQLPMWLRRWAMFDP